MTCLTFGVDSLASFSGGDSDDQSPGPRVIESGRLGSLSRFMAGPRSASAECTCTTLEAVVLASTVDDGSTAKGAAGTKIPAAVPLVDLLPEALPSGTAARALAEAARRSTGNLSLALGRELTG